MAQAGPAFGESFGKGAVLGSVSLAPSAFGCGDGFNLNKLVPSGEGDISMGKRFAGAVKWAIAVLVAATVFAGGYAAGQNRVGQPKTIIHVVEIKWNPGISEVQKQKVLDGLKQVAMKTPGVKNVWTQADRLEPRDFNAAFAIEFASRDAADAYAESALHDEWDKLYVPLRQTSISIQVTNP
jgi:hypothetical protein